MTSTSTPMDHGSPAPTPISDASELERLFRDRYSALVEEAKVDLGAAAPAAPRVVETVFRQVWEERARLTSPDQVDKFLHESVHHGAARELSRRASVHRYDAKTSTAPRPSTASNSIDESWTRVAHALHLDGTTANPADAERVSKQVLRHDAAEHVAALAKPPAWKVPALIVTVAAAVAIGGLYISNRLLENRKIERALSDPEARTHQAASGQMAIVNLDDGTRVTLSPESKMIVPKHFGAEMRAVRVIGSARFAVAPGQKTPFQVRALRTTATAIGTDFTIRLDNDADSTVAVLVREGTVSVAVGDSSRVANVDKTVATSNKGVLREATATEKEELSAWTDGQLVLADRQLRTILPELKRWYGLDIKVTDLPLLDRKVTVRASLDSPMSAIRSVEQSGALKFGYEDKTMVLRDGAPAKKK